MINRKYPPLQAQMAVAIRAFRSARTWCSLAGSTMCHFHSPVHLASKTTYTQFPILSKHTHNYLVYQNQNSETEEIVLIHIAFICQCIK